MSPTLTMMRNQVALFQQGQISMDVMWENIDTTITRIKSGQLQADPYEDDKAERTPPAKHIITQC
jgi:hypothetical protein